MSSSSGIHPTAIIDASAHVAADVTIGPYAYIGPNVTLHEGVQVGHATTIERNTVIGAHTRIWPQAVVGVDPQDLKYAGEESRLEIGMRCMIREFSSLHRGTQGGGMVTKIGNDVLIMNGAHVGHDAQVGDKCIIAAHSALGGHVIMGEQAIIGGVTAIHQWVRVGDHAMVGAGVMVARDIPPYGVVKGEDEHLAGVNLVGLKRRGFSRQDARDITDAMKVLFLERADVSFATAVAQVQARYESNPAIQVILDFIAETAEKNRQRGFTNPKK